MSQRGRKRQVLGGSGGGGIVLVIIITRPIKTDPLLVKTTGHNSPRRFRSGAVSVLSSSFTHSISVGCSRRASEGLLVASWSLNGVGAWPVLLNFFTLKLKIEAVNLECQSPLWESPWLPFVCLFKVNKNWGSSNQESGTWPLHVPCPVAGLISRHP